MNFSRYLIFLLICGFMAFSAATVVKAQDAVEPELNLPKGLTEDELSRLHEIGLNFTETDPPSGTIRNIAEFERNEAVLVRYSPPPASLAWPLDLIAAISEHVTVVTLVANSSVQSTAQSTFQNAGVNMDNVEFLQASTNSVWTRDYGPFYIANEDQEISIVDFIYNRPRPLDDAVPGQLATMLDMPYYGMNLVHTGGNFMADGWGMAASTDLIYEENNFNENLVLSQMADYLNISEYHVTIDPQNSAISHIDTWAKFLDVDKILIARVPQGSMYYEQHEQVVEYFENATSAWGTPYQVYRIDTPDLQPGNPNNYQPHPYTNSLIVNERVYVPLMNTEHDEAAIAAYEAALPGYEILGFTGNPGFNWNHQDALHCRVKEIPDRGMLSIQHLPITGEQPRQDTFDFDATIIAHSGEDLIDDQLYLIYQFNDAPYDTVSLSHSEDHVFSASLDIPANVNRVSYYFHAADESGRVETLPLIGKPGARTFTIDDSDFITSEQNYSLSWSLAGLPVDHYHTGLSEIFGDSILELLSFNGESYEPAGAFSGGSGYWLKMEDAENITFFGPAFESHSVDLTEGWNLISGPDAAAVFGSINDPDGILEQGSLFGFEAGYFMSESLEPGLGYWVKANADGTISFDSDGDPASRPGMLADFNPDEFHRVSLSDGVISSQLYFGSDFDEPAGEFGYELPPLPPSGVFDARFSDQTWLKSDAEVTILLQQSEEDAEFMLHAPDGIPTEYLVKFYTGSNMVDEANIREGETVSISAQIDRIELTVLGEPTSIGDGGNDLPREFSLAQNYPNPFNPVTRIQYELPEQSNVRISVYTITGSRVATLVNETQNAGMHSVSFDGARLSSGVYIYRIEAGSFTQSRKMILLK